MDVVTKTKMSFRKEQWKQLIMDRQASGLTIEKWCQQQGLKKSTYYKWLRIIRADACQSLPDPTPSITVPFVKIGVEEENPAAILNSSNPSSLAKPESSIHIRLRDADITIPNGTNPKTIRATLLALTELC